jgi:hypothetical protein
MLQYLHVCHRLTLQSSMGTSVCFILSHSEIATSNPVPCKTLLMATAHSSTRQYSQLVFYETPNIVIASRKPQQVITCKTQLFITTAVRTSNPTRFHTALQSSNTYKNYVKQLLHRIQWNKMCSKSSRNLFLQLIKLRSHQYNHAHLPQPFPLIESTVQRKGGGG